MSDAISYATGDMHTHFLPHSVHEGWFLDGTNNKATFQQYSIVPAEILAKIPSSMAFEEAATIPLGLGTAAVGLYMPLGEAAKPFSSDIYFY